MILKRVTFQQLKDFAPCYDPASKLPKSFEGNAIDLLNNLTITGADKMWCVTREYFLPLSSIKSIMFFILNEYAIDAKILPYVDDYKNSYCLETEEAQAWRKSVKYALALLNESQPFEFRDALVLFNQDYVTAALYFYDKAVAGKPLVESKILSYVKDQVNSNGYSQ